MKPDRKHKTGAAQKNHFFSTIGADPQTKRAQIEQYLSGAASNIFVAPLQTGGSFDLEDYAACCSSLIVGTRRVYGYLEYERDEKSISAFPIKAAAFVYLESGSLIINNNFMCAGDFYIVDYQKPFKISFLSDTVTRGMFVPMEKIYQVSNEISEMHGKRSVGSMSILLKNYIFSLNKHMNKFSSISSGVISATLSILKTCLSNEKTMTPRIVDCRDQERAARLNAFIEENLTYPDLTLEYICQTTGISRRVVQRIFKPHGGVNAYVRRKRLDIAYKKLSFDERNSIAEVAHEIGIRNASYFSSIFKAEFGVAPSHVRKVDSGLFHKTSGVFSRP